MQSCLVLGDGIVEPCPNESNFILELNQTTIEYRDQLDSLEIGVCSTCSDA